MVGVDLRLWKWGDLADEFGVGEGLGDVLNHDSCFDGLLDRGADSEDTMLFE